MKILFRWAIIAILCLAGLGGQAPGRAAANLTGAAAVVPALTLLSPTVVAAGSPAFTLTVYGTDFSATSVVQLAGVAHPTNFVSATQLTTSVSASEVVATGKLRVTVFNPDAGGGVSPALDIYVYYRDGIDINADGVLGQPSFSTNANSSLSLLSATNGLSSPRSVAVDHTTGRLFVVDSSNNRVLSWPSAPAFANSQAADLVIGQGNFTTTTAGAISAASLNGPRGVVVDAQGNLYVADYTNNRVLEFAAPLSSGMDASRVFGQADFVSGTANAPSADTLDSPAEVALDSAGNLFVADYNNNRVLRYDAPFTDTTADLVIGQPDFVTTTAAATSASSLDTPRSVALDAQGNLFVADNGNNRVLQYSAPLTNNGMAAHKVFGQADFVSSTANAPSGTASASSLSDPRGIAVDAHGYLYVADYGNNRVLVYFDPVNAVSAAADRVFGQPDFISSIANNVPSPLLPGPKEYNLNSPSGLAFDAANNLYIADQKNNRVLEFDQLDHALFLPLVDH
jgi:sugar lactone lactonase YvrE